MYERESIFCMSSCVGEGEFVCVCVRVKERERERQTEREREIVYGSGEQYT